MRDGLQLARAVLADGLVDAVEEDEPRDLHEVDADVLHLVRELQRANS